MSALRCTLAEVRSAVQCDWLAARCKQEAEDSYRALRAKYAVVVESGAKYSLGDAVSQGGAPVLAGAQ